MASHRRPKQPSRTRVTVLTATAAAAVALTSQAAHAAPASRPRRTSRPRSTSSTTRRSRPPRSTTGPRRSRTSSRRRSATSRTRWPAARSDLNTLRDGLGSMATAQYRTGGIDPSVQLFLSADPDTYLDKASTLDQLSGQQAEALKKIQEKQRTLAQERAGGRRQAHGPRRHPQGTRQEEAAGPGQARRGAEAAQHPDRRGAAARWPRTTPRASRSASARVDLGNEVPASQRGAAALEPPPAQIGKPYVSGGTGPSSFDCSGLTQWAYAQAGVEHHPHHAARRPTPAPQIGMSAAQARRPGLLLQRPAPRRPLRGQRPGAARPEARRRRALRVDEQHRFLHVRRPHRRLTAAPDNAPVRANSGITR